jgi:hypothetical protein
MGLWWSSKSDTVLVVVSFEGAGRLRLNGIRVRHNRTKQNAERHGQTVCWIEFGLGGERLEQGLGPEAGRLDEGQVQRLLRDLPGRPECQTVLQQLSQGKERAGHWLTWGGSQESARGTMGQHGRS